MRRVILSLFLLFISFSFGTIYRKHLAGPVEEFSQFQLPVPQDAAVEEYSAAIEVFFSADAANSAIFLWNGELYVDSDELFSFSVFSPAEKNLQITLKDPSGNEVDLSKHKHDGKLAHFPIGLVSIPGINYYFEAPFQKGVYSIKIVTSKISPKLHLGSEPDALVFLYNHSPIKLHSYLNTYDLRVGGKIGLVTRLTDAAEGVSRPSALKDVVSSAVMEVHNPNGIDETIQMHDDGLHDDELPNDGVYGGYLSASESGIYRAEAFVTGVSPSGEKIVRSTQHLLPIAEEAVQFSGIAFAVPKDSDHIDILVSVVPIDNSDSKSYNTYTELWGTDSNGNQVAACWLGGLTDIQTVDGVPIVSFELDLNWIKRAGVQAPLTLKNVRIQDVDTHVPLDQMSEIPVQVLPDLLPHVKAPMAIEITKEMRQGVFPEELLRVNASAAAPTLLLVHGYCSDVNPWAKYLEDFTEASYFLEPLASLTNDEFAKLVIQHADDEQMTHWGGIGHSQGGIVLAHIANYYFSGLDKATGGRMIQSVGTPFQGCTGAGSAANLIKLFGFGCGENFDLTVDGTKLWLAGITPETRKQVYYYTTTYKQGKLFGDYCNLAVNLLLKWPNDGVTELSYASLDGGNSMGNTEEWCHTVDMSYTAQYYDHTRNQLMNKLTGR